MEKIGCEKSDFTHASYDTGKYVGYSMNLLQQSDGGIRRRSSASSDANLQARSSSSDMDTHSHRGIQGSMVHMLEQFRFSWESGYLHADAATIVRGSGAEDVHGLPDGAPSLESVKRMWVGSDRHSTLFATHCESVLAFLTLGLHVCSLAPDDVNAFSVQRLVINNEYELHTLGLELMIHALEEYPNVLHMGYNVNMLGQHAQNFLYWLGAEPTHLEPTLRGQ